MRGYRAKRVKNRKGDERMHGSNREPVSHRKGFARGYQGVTKASPVRV